MKYFLTLREKFCIATWPCNILYIWNKNLVQTLVRFKPESLEQQYALYLKLSYITTFLVFFAFDSLISLFVLGVFFSIKESYDITNKTCIKQVYKHFLWTTHQKWLVTHHDNNVRLERHHFFIIECPNGYNWVSHTAKHCYSTNRKRINVMCDILFFLLIRRSIFSMKVCLIALNLL